MRGGSRLGAGEQRLTREQALTIMDAPGVKRDADGKPIASAETITIVDLPTTGDDSWANVTVRGVGPQGVRGAPGDEDRRGPHVQARRARAHRRHEGAQRSSRRWRVGKQHQVRGQPNGTIVGVFESGGDSHESEMLGDARDGDVRRIAATAISP